MKHKLTTLFTAIVLICCSSFNTVVANELTLPEKLSLPAQTIEPQSFNAGSTIDQLVISASYPWFGVVGGRVTIPASEVQSVKLWLEPNFSTTERRGVISVTKTSDGTTTTIPVIQPPYFTSVTNGFPARLETKNSSNDGWESNGIATPANSSAVLSAVSASGKRLAFTEDGGLEMIVKDKSQAGGPLEQYSTIGFKMETNGATILYPERLVVAWSCSTYSNIDEANYDPTYYDVTQSPYYPKAT
jgi:hypothetical protein